MLDEAGFNGVGEPVANGEGRVVEEISPHAVLNALLSVLLLFCIGTVGIPSNFHFRRTIDFGFTAVIVFFFS